MANKYKMPLFKPLAAVLPDCKELSVAAAQVEHCANVTVLRQTVQSVISKAKPNCFILQIYSGASVNYFVLSQ